MSPHSSNPLGLLLRIVSAPVTRGAPHTLIWLVRTFELAQRERIRRGERIRAIAQARDLSWDAPVPDMDADSLLASIEHGDTRARVERAHAGRLVFDDPCRNQRVVADIDDFGIALIAQHILREYRLQQLGIVELRLLSAGAHARADLDARGGACFLPAG